MTCATCRFWKAYPHDEAGEGECRRNAPVATTMNAPQVDRRGILYRLYAFWPVCHATDGCGQWEETAPAARRLPLEVCA